MEYQLAEIKAKALPGSNVARVFDVVCNIDEKPESLHRASPSQHVMATADAQPPPVLLKGAYDVTGTSGTRMQQTVPSASRCCRPLTRNCLMMQHLALSPAAILCRKAQAMSTCTQMHTSLMQISLWGQGCPLWGQGCPLHHMVRLTRGTATA